MGGLALVLRVSEVQLTMQRTSSADPPPPPEGIPRQRQPPLERVSLGTMWGEGWG